MSADHHKVAVVTGGLISGQERSLLHAVRKLVLQQRSARSAWLDMKIKLVAGEPLVAAALERAVARFTAPDLYRAVEPYFNDATTLDTPPLTEVVLASLLGDAGMPYEILPLDTLFLDAKRARRVLDDTDCVFLSATYLHDLSELSCIVERLKRPHNHLVVGGALTGVIHDRWDGMAGVDVVAVGYGESLVPVIVDWIRSDFQDLRPPPRGRLVEKSDSPFLFSGVPETKSLDFLPLPDWGAAERRAGRRLPMIYYESVRGCPYRCRFCNYPYLFDDTKFRTKSAEKMADDWQVYVEELGVRYITCLDSLFTNPRQRLVDFCNLLIDRGIRVKWICYARADDLADEATVRLMKRAGAHQVQIGIESADPELLRNMNKKCSPEANARALVNCRKHGLTTVVSLIVGFPGETRDSLETTYRFLEQTPPDFYFLATFSTRVAGVPILEPPVAARFGLEVMPSLHNMAPYWRHDTMSCAEVGNHVRQLDRRIMENRVALNSALFYQGLLSFRSEEREALLDFQQRAIRSHPLLRASLAPVHWIVDAALRRDVARHFAPPTPDRAAARATS